ncbi:MAG: hypothetical protein CVT98_06180, partial [Bacteroidetes bacterium HGW-Bacteroidetes-15]
MIKYFTAFILLLLFTIIGFSEEVSDAAASKVIKGIVYDSQTNQPLEYATVSLIRLDNNSLVTGTITDSNGYFRIAGIDVGFYRIEITFIGYNTKVIDNFEVSTNHRSFDAGTVILEAASEAMEGVMIIADRPT